VLAHARRDDRVVQLLAVPEDLPQPPDGVLGDDRVGAVREAQRLGVAPLVDLPPPVGVAPAGSEVCSGPRSAILPSRFAAGSMTRRNETLSAALMSATRSSLSWRNSAGEYSSSKRGCITVSSSLMWRRSSPTKLAYAR